MSKALLSTIAVALCVTVSVAWAETDLTDGLMAFECSEGETTYPFILIEKDSAWSVANTETTVEKISEDTFVIGSNKEHLHIHLRRVEAEQWVVATLYEGKQETNKCRELPDLLDTIAEAIAPAIVSNSLLKVQEKEAELTALQASKQADLAALQASKEAALKKLKRKKFLELNALRKSKDAAILDLIRSNKAELAELRSNHNSELSSKDRRLTALRESKNARLAANKKLKEEELTTLKEQHQIELKKVKEEYLKKLLGK